MLTIANIAFAIQKKPSEAIKPHANNKAATLAEFSDIILEKVNPKAKIVCEEKRIRPEKSEVMQLLCDNSLARELAGWAPEYTLEEGLTLTVEWMKENIALYKPGVYTV